MKKNTILYIGVSGHRDLKQSEIPHYQQQVHQILSRIVAEHPDRDVRILSPLADGADRLVVQVGRELGLEYEALLPLPSSLYEQDFSPDSLEAYRQLLSGARVPPRVIPWGEGCTAENCAEYGEHRDRQYRLVGEAVVDQSEQMIFLWDGVRNHLVGGTAAIHTYAQASYPKRPETKIFWVKCAREQSAKK